jgi:hypothetical protein
MAERMFCDMLGHELCRTVYRAAINNEMFKFPATSFECLLRSLDAQHVLGNGIERIQAGCNDRNQRLRSANVIRVSLNQSQGFPAISGSGHGLGVAALSYSLPQRCKRSGCWS